MSKIKELVLDQQEYDMHHCDDEYWYEQWLQIQGFYQYPNKHTSDIDLNLNKND